MWLKPRCTATSEHYNRSNMQQLLRLIGCGLLVVCLMEVAQAGHPRDYHHDEEMMPGWLGSDYQPPNVKSLEERKRHMQVLDADARIFLWKGFLTPEEADHIHETANSRLSRSGVVATDNGGSEISDIRTSFGTFLERGEDDIVLAVEKRIAEWTLLPMGNGEGLQVLRYQHGQKYDAHWDYFFDKNGIANGGNRYATVLMYLTDVEEGGETVFPNIPAPGGVNEGFSECARHNLAAKPHKGDAILFHSIKPNGELEKRSLHTACPVIKGEKWSAAKWIHVAHYAIGNEEPERVEQHIQPEGIKPGVPGCEDKEEMCGLWASSGECTRNTAYMVGTRARPGQCLMSCNACDVVRNTGAEINYRMHRKNIQ